MLLRPFPLLSFPHFLPPQMDLQNFFTATIIILAIDRILSIDPKFEACAPYACRNGPNISYPFWVSHEQESYCGFPNFEITCNEKNPVLNISNDDYIVRDIFYANQSFMVANAAVYEEDSCPAPMFNFTIDRTPFHYSPDFIDLFVLYNCTSEPPDYVKFPVDCASNATHHSFAGFHAEVLLKSKNFSLDSCQSLVNAPVNVDSGVDFERLLQMSYVDILKMGFVLIWTENNCSNCQRSGGRCGFDNNEFICFCYDRPHLKTCDDDGKDWKLKVTIGLITAFVSITIMSVIFYIYLRRNKNQHAPFLSRNISPDSSSMTDAEKGGSHYGVHLFNYGELEEATNHFDSAKELGDGGFGTVYHGKLRDGRAVAVKRLYENNYRRVEQFMNEVDILTRLRHQNLVSLYGCTSRHSRELLLVYEYIPNGTVADHLHGERAKPGELPWPIRMNIAIDTACALAYLHASEIIHRDVKTNNILLDNNFCVKVADFGLSRLFPTDVTHVSTAPQGTPGYVDPEYHQCYQLTSKSDVYSFGVVLMELISSQPAVDITRHRHEINLSTMAINKIQNHELHKLVDTSLGFESDHTIRKTIGAVAELAFRCLQNAKEMRPSMVEVLQDLKDIQSDDYNEHKAAEMDIPKDDAVLLKNEQLPFSPDSVTTKWISTDTIRNPSG